LLSAISKPMLAVPPPEPPNPLKERSGLDQEAKYLNGLARALLLSLAVELAVEHFPKISRAHLPAYPDQKRFPVFNKSPSK